MIKLQKPLLVYDGECAFCIKWIKRWRNIIGTKIDYAPFQRVAEHFPKVPKHHFHESVILIQTNGRVISGALAVFESLAYGGRRQWLWFYKKIPGFAQLSELIYAVIAKNRSGTPYQWLLVIIVTLTILAIASVF